VSLQNLLQTGKLKEHAPTAAEVVRLLAAIERNLADSSVTAVSNETRFDAAYKAVMQCALAAMLASGYRPATSEPGHHLTLIQSLPLTLGMTNDAWVVLDALRRKRNANDYTGDIILPNMVSECVTQARKLNARLHAHLKAHQPELLKIPK
jgi:hypothetical protein